MAKPEFTEQVDFDDDIVIASVTLSGSKAAVIKEYLNDTNNIGSSTARYFANTSGTSTGSVNPLDVSNYKRKMIKVRNSYDVAVSITIIEYRILNAGTSSGPERFQELVTIEVLAAGASKVWDDLSNVKLGLPSIGLAVRVSFTGAPTTGFVDVIIIGGPL